MLVTIGIAGLLTPMLLFGAQGLIQVGGAEPPFDAAAAEIHAYFSARNPGLYSAGTYLTVLGIGAFLWFLGGLHAVLRSFERGIGWRSTVALISGVLALAAVVNGSWAPAVFRIEEGVDPQLARFAFDTGNFSFATAWVLFGSFSLATGWLILSSRGLPSWLGWWALVAGAGLVAARALWTSPVWIVPYLLFWLWVMVLSVRLLKARDHLELPRRAPSDTGVHAQTAD